MTITLNNEKVEKYLEILVSTGLFGHSKQDAARRLIEDQIFNLLSEDSWIFAGMNKDE